MYPIGSDEAYSNWARDQDTLSDLDRQAIKRRIAGLVARPLFSLVIMAFDESGHGLKIRALASILSQLYPHFEILAPANLLEACRDSRSLSLPASGLDSIELYNAALARATGDYIIAVPADAQLAEHALLEFADALLIDPVAKLIFTDEDCIDDAGRRIAPRFKTAWDIDLMLGRDAVGTLAAVSITTARQLGGLRRDEMSPMSGGAVALYDLYLRLGHSALPGTIHHLPAVLCHREPSAAAVWDTTAARQIVRRHLTEIGLAAANVEPAPLLPRFNRIRRPLPAPIPLVSILVPTRDQAEVLARCAEGVLSRTDYDRLEFIIIDNESRDPVTHALFAKLGQDPRVHILPSPGVFNFAALNNAAIMHAQGEVVVLLNSDTEVINPDWLAEMVSHAIRPEVGAVGAKLLYADTRVQHCGVTLGPGWALTHQLRLSARDYPGPGGELALVRRVSAVTGACMAMRRSVYQEVGGLDAVNFGVAFNDIDICLRMADFGYQVICTPFAELFHLESTTRGYDDTSEKQDTNKRQAEAFRHLWEPMLETDPYHNPNLMYLWESAEYVTPRRRCSWRRPGRQRSNISTAHLPVGRGGPEFVVSVRR